MTLDRSTLRSAGAAGPQSVGRVFAVLDYLVAHRDGATLSELATHCEAPRTSLLGLLNGMLQEGCVARPPGGRYRLGPRVIGLAMRAVAGAELKALAHPFLERLMHDTGETVALATLAPEGDSFTYLDRVESVNPIRYAVTVGERRDLYCTASGKVLLAWLPKERLDAYLATQQFQRFTPRTITGAARLRAELRRVREQGIARTDGERFRDASGVAAPVFLADGSVGAALLVVGPSPRMAQHDGVNECAVRGAAAELTQALGGVAAP